MSEKLMDRLRYLEKFKWKQLASLDRADGLTVEDPNSESYAMIDRQNYELEQFTEKYYFHLRIEKQKGKFRIFGYQRRNVFCITQIDYKGQIHHT